MTADYSPYLTAVDDELRQLLSYHSGTEYRPATAQRLAPLYSMMAYHLGWVDARSQPVESDRGKRIRPLLCLLCCEGAGGDWSKAVPAAAGLELVHNFSLIHDDIEDNSPTRRGRPTVWAVWGLAHGINTGDAMLMLARLAIGRLSRRGVEPDTILQAMNLLDRTCLQLCEGQYLDMAGEGHLDLSEEAYLQMIGGKTAALMAASTQMGALIGGAREATEHYRQFGWHLGLAFQMVDDLLGIWGAPEVTGKPAADDLRSRKMTLPVIFALRNPSGGKMLARFYGQSTLSDDDVAQAVAILEEAGAQQYVFKLAEQHATSAMAALDAASPNPRASASLRDLASSLTGRQK